MNKKGKNKPRGAADTPLTLNMCWVWQLWILDLQVNQYVCRIGVFIFGKSFWCVH